MASIISDPNGRKRIQFINGDGNRMTIRLGEATMVQAREFQRHVTRLALGQFDPGTAKWLEALGDRHHAKLAAVGLVAPRQSTTLGPWLENYIESRRNELKESSIGKLEITRDKLLTYFKPTTALRNITPDQASQWRQRLLSGDAEGKGKLAEASVKHHVGNAKGFFSEAERRKLIERNPFEHLESGATAAKNDRYVTPDETDAILAACPDMRWKVLFGLARLAGLRCPSETHLVTFRDVQWEKDRLIVRSPKTERHKGHDQRIVPIVPKLMALLQDAREALPDGASDLIVTIRGHGHLHDGMHRIIKRAQVEPWPRLWQTLRSSCEKEWAMRFPQYAVSRWVGHSITVSGKHYANSVPDELFERAALDVKLGNPDDKPANSTGKRAAQKAAHSQAEQQEMAEAGNTKSPEFPGFSEGLPSVQVAGGGFEPPTSGL